MDARSQPRHNDGRFAQTNAQMNQATLSRVRSYAQQTDQDRVLHDAATHAETVTATRLADAPKMPAKDFCRSVADEVEAWLEERHGSFLDLPSDVPLGDNGDRVPTRYVARMNTSWAALQAHRAHSTL